MSRCFPFPPPGYERKAREEDYDFLKKERYKEKKHKKEKKEKKEKEKREGRSKKDKDKKRDNHKDKKGHNEKHKDKKGKDRSRPLNERKIEADTVGLSRTKISGNSQQAQIYPKVVELSKIIDDEEKGRENRVAHTLVSSYESIDGLGKALQGVVDNIGLNRTKISGNSQQAQIYPKVVKLSKIIDDEEKGRENRLAYTLASSYESIDGLGKALQGVIDNIGCTGKTIKGSNFNVAENFTGKIEENIGGNKTIQGLKSINQRSEGISLLQNKEKGVERWEDRNADLYKRNQKTSKDNIKNEKKNGMEQKNNYKHRNNDLLQQSQANFLNIKHPHTAQVCEGNVDAKEKSLKRKKSLINGFFCEHDISPNKLMRVTPDLSTDIGGQVSEKKFLSSFQCSDNKLKPVHERKDNMENKINGKVISEESIFMKPPHPDAKYLSRVLSLPKMKEWSELDDQEWLIQKNKQQSNHTSNHDSTEIPQVWEKGVRMELADIYALPYVIPY